MKFYLGSNLLFFAFMSMAVACGSSPSQNARNPAPAIDGPVNMLNDVADEKS